MDTFSQHPCFGRLGYPRRFSWKMRFFVTVFVFCLSYRCFAVLFPMSDWCRAYAVDELPPPLPSPAERYVLNAKAGPGDLYPVLTACLRTAQAVGHYLVPWPAPETRKRIKSPLDAVKCGACWLYGRVLFVERLCGLHENWDLYAPSVDTFIYHTRARLCFSDGSDIVLKQHAEPEDFTHFGHWFEERIVNYEYLVADDFSQSWAYCKLLAQRHPQNAQGAKLVRVVLFQVVVALVPPGGNAIAHYWWQNRLTASPPLSPGTFHSNRKRTISGQVFPDFFEFDVIKESGWWL
jgi:hypothetical protein